MNYTALLLVAGLMLPGEADPKLGGFSGTWTLNREKSVNAAGKPSTKLVVKLDSSQMSVRTMKEGKPARSMNYKLDGSETRAEEDEGMFVIKKRGRLKQSASGSTLELVTVFALVGKGNMTIESSENTVTETFELVEGGMRVVSQERDGDTVVAQSDLFYQKD